MQRNNGSYFRASELNVKSFWCIAQSWQFLNKTIVCAVSLGSVSAYAAARLGGVSR
ncbi:hypothetical protein DO70_5296 [Burkholderia pseudomallei]|nr:hypothetical protein DO70_5296 [Burkholderia pseudomallei]KGD51885.1 hypothetical protein DP43_5640 [Burkholderia pseudomallei]